MLLQRNVAGLWIDDRAHSHRISPFPFGEGYLRYRLLRLLPSEIDNVH